MHDQPTLDQARRDADLSMTDLWIRYFALGGTSKPIELEAYVLGVLHPDSREHNLVVHAINETHLERSGNHPVPYVDDTTDPLDS